ncbi:hypothetical protein D9Q98_007636 [Chlorella vulgaris]|uniref:Uncharacterized protein n=1 Tax=Chlorella vulgaris TaxID=3077 RepID=A0A9D4YVZ3_CHLVU|nr:hypothetical protein D9Q98_007636 [Chlorella vulgaris]
MQTSMCFSRVTVRPAVFAKSTATRCNAVRAARLVVRAEANQSERPTVVEEPVSTPPASAPAPSSAIAAEPFSILGVQQEAINGRAAMIGFAIAIASELATGQSIWSQIAGKYVDRELVQQPIGAATMAFAFTVVALTFATFAPTVFKNEGPKDRKFGPFTPKAETWNGRLAMLGFSGLLLVELLKGNNPLF